MTQIALFVKYNSSKYGRHTLDLKLFAWQENSNLMVLFLLLFSSNRVSEAF
jgi:hypothetical protein